MQYYDLFENFYGEAHERPCPICGETHIALNKVVLLMGDTEISITEKNNIHISHLDGNPSRGIILRRFYYCEYGHHFLIEERFYKGFMYEALKEVPITLEMPNQGVLWRD